MERGVPIRSISRCIAVLQVINRKGSLSLMGIARAAELPYPTTCRMIQTLIHEGLVECEPTRKFYRATALVRTLSQGFPKDDRLLTAARPHIEAFTAEAGWPVSVITRVGPSMMVRDSTQDLTSLTFALYLPGFAMPLLECASGYVHLAHLDAAERDELVASLPATDRRANALLSAPFDEATAARIRADGYATYERQAHAEHPGITSSISVPIFEEGLLVGALTMSFFASMMPIADALGRHLGDLKGTAATIGEALARLPKAEAPFARRRGSEPAVARVRRSSSAPSKAVRA